MDLEMSHHVIASTMAGEEVVNLTSVIDVQKLPLDIRDDDEVPIEPRVGIVRMCHEPPRDEHEQCTGQVDRDRPPFDKREDGECAREDARRLPDDAQGGG